MAGSVVRWNHFSEKEATLYLMNVFVLFFKGGGVDLEGQLVCM